MRSAECKVFTADPNPLVAVRDMPRFDGSTWQELEYANEILTLTSVGRVYLAANNIATLLHDYVEDARAGRSSRTDTRRYLAEGGNAQVFTLGDTSLAIKEKRSGSKEELLPSLYRMDTLADAIEKHCPRWIDIPPHYGVCVPKDDPTKQYMLMEQIDSGVTVGDVLGAYEQPRENHIRDSVFSIFGEVSLELQEEIQAQYVEYKGLLADALIKEKKVPDSILVDIHNKYNTVIEPLPTPVAGKKFKLSVIDQ